MNGAVIYDSFHRQVLRRVVLKPTVLQDIVQSVHEALPEACFAVERITSEMTPSTGEGPVEEFLIAENNEHIWYEQNAPRTSLAALAEEPAAKLLVRAEDISSAEMAEVLCPLVEPVANATYSVDGGLVEISHPVATKGRRWCGFWITGICRRRRCWRSVICRTIWTCWSWRRGVWLWRTRIRRCRLQRMR